MPAAHKAAEALQLFDAVEVAHSGVVNDPVARLGEDRGGQVVADDRPLLDFAVDICHVHVARHEHVDRPGNLVADAAGFGAILFHHRAHTGAARHVHGGQGATGQGLTGMGAVPAAFVLVVIAFVAQHTPGAGDADIAHPGDQRVRNLRPAICKAFAGPFARIVDQFIWRHVEWAKFLHAGYSNSVRQIAPILVIPVETRLRQQNHLCENRCIPASDSGDELRRVRRLTYGEIRFAGWKAILTRVAGFQAIAALLRLVDVALPVEVGHALLQPANEY